MQFELVVEATMGCQIVEFYNRAPNSISSPFLVVDL